MLELFDTRSQGLTELPYAVFGLLPLAALALSGAARRRWPWFVGLAVLLTGLAAGVPIWDHQRLRHVQGVHTARGPLTGVWRQASAVRDFRTGFGKGYHRWTTEGFTVGHEAFSYVMGSGFSSATFTNVEKRPLEPYQGRMAEVSWFEDPAAHGDRRILRLAVETTVRAAAAPAPASFAAFWNAFSSAAGRGDRAPIKAMTGFPFMFSGFQLGADRFDTLWAGLFTPANRACLASARPIAEGQTMEAFCGGTIFIFAHGPNGWRFTGIGADD
jgi:hypothetical protein